MGNMERSRDFNQIVNILREQGKALCHCISRLLIAFLFNILLMDKVLSLLTCGKRPEWDNRSIAGFLLSVFLSYLFILLGEERQWSN